MAIKYGAEKAADLTVINQLKGENENLKEELARVYQLINNRKEDYDDLSKQVMWNCCYRELRLFSTKN